MGQEFIGGASQGFGSQLQAANQLRAQQEQFAQQLELRKAQFDFEKKQLDVERKATEERRKRIEGAFKQLQQAQVGSTPGSGPVPGTESQPPSGTAAQAISPELASGLQFDAAGVLAGAGNPNAAGAILSRLLPPTPEQRLKETSQKQTQALRLQQFELEKNQFELRERQLDEQRRQFNAQNQLATRRTESQIKLDLARADKAKAQATGTTTILPDGTIQIAPADQAKKVVTPARAARAKKFDEDYDNILDSNRKIGQLHQFLSQNPNAAGLSSTVSAAIASTTERVLSLNPEVKGKKAEALVNTLRTQATDAANTFDYLFNSVLFQVAADNQQNRGILTDDDVKRAERQLGAKFGFKPTASALLPRLEALMKNQTDSAERALKVLQEEGLNNKPPLEFPVARQTSPASVGPTPSTPVTPQGGASGSDREFIMNILRQRAAAGDAEAQEALNQLGSQVELVR